jgi:hypothetical protein
MLRLLMIRVGTRESTPRAPRAGSATRQFEEARAAPGTAHVLQSGPLGHPHQHAERICRGVIGIFAAAWLVWGRIRLVGREVWSAFGEPTMHLTSRPLRLLDEAVAVGSALGDEHPLSRVLRRLGVLREQSLVVAGVLLVSIGALVEGVSGALPVVVAASAVLALLVCGSRGSLLTSESGRSISSSAAVVTCPSTRSSASGNGSLIGGIDGSWDGRWRRYAMRPRILTGGCGLALRCSAATSCVPSCPTSQTSRGCYVAKAPACAESRKRSACSVMAARRCTGTTRSSYAKSCIRSASSLRAEWSPRQLNRFAVSGRPWRGCRRRIARAGVLVVGEQNGRAVVDIVASPAPSRWTSAPGRYRR